MRKKPDKDRCREMTPEEVEKSGKKKALDLLSRRDYSTMALKKKLQEYGYQEAFINTSIEYVRSFHYIDDVRYAEILIRQKKGSISRRALLNTLREKNISDEDIVTAMEEAYINEESDESPEEETIRSLIRKMHYDPGTIESVPYEERQKLGAKLFRRGFNFELVKSMLNL